MPKVTPEHLAQRRRQILDAALGLFAADGFHATSMHDIIAASGMSAGAVYHYFPTKRGLIEAASVAVAEELMMPLRTLPSRREPPTPVEVIELICAHFATLHTQTPDLTRLAVFLWAEELRDPELSGVADAKRDLLNGLVPLVQRWRQTGVVQSDCDPVAVASVLFGLLPGYLLQLTTLGAVPPRSYAVSMLAIASGVMPTPAHVVPERSMQHRWRPVGPTN